MTDTNKSPIDPVLPLTGIPPAGIAPPPAIAPTPIVTTCECKAAVAGYIGVCDVSTCPCVKAGRECSLLCGCNKSCSPPLFGRCRCPHNSLTICPDRCPCWINNISYCTDNCACECKNAGGHMYARGASYKGHCKCNGVCNPSTCDCKSDDGSIKCSISCSCDCLNSGDAIAIDDDDDDLSIIGAKSARLSTPSSLSLSAGISTTKKSRKAKTPPPALKSCDCDLEEGQDYCTGCSCVDEKGEATCTAACNCKCKAAEEVETLEEADAANLIIAQSGILAEEVANNAARYASLPDFSHSDPDATAAADRQAFFDYLFASNPSADQIAAAIPFARRVRQIVKSNHCVLVVAVVPNVLGWGVFAAHDIAADTTIVPYRGFPLTGSSWASLLHHKNKKFDEYGEGTRYMMSVRLSYKNSAGVIMHYPSSNPIWVNPAPYHQGAVARYINHVSSGANTAVCPWTGDKGAIIGDGSYVVAVRDIVAGEELRFNYGGGVKVALASNKFKIMAIERKPRFDAKCDADLASIIRQFGIDDDSKLPSSWRSVYRSACSINSLADSVLYSLDHFLRLFFRT